MAVSKPPPVRPIKSPPMTPPPVSKTQDTYSHHTSPVKGPQAVAPEVVTAQAPKAKIKKIPDVPQAKYKHTDE